MTDVPAPLPSPEPNTNGRDAKGRFSVGCAPGPGRPPGLRRPDIFVIAERKAAESGDSVESILWRVLTSMIRRAERGDAVAARLVLDRLANNDELAVRVMVDQLTDVERAARIESILAVARARQQQLPEVTNGEPH